MTCCKIDGCDREATYKAAQLCKRHYLRHWRGGSRLSLAEQVAEVVIARGRLNFDEVAASFPGWETKTVRKALQNACQQRLIVLEGRGVGNRYLTLAPAVYRAPAPEEFSGKPKAKPDRTLVASVFDLGSPRPLFLPTVTGRKYSPLGDWNAP